MTSTILIVDDEPAGRQTIESILEEQGYHLEMAENGIQALDMAREIQPDVILLDVMMPGMNGFEVCKRMRGETSLAGTPIIMITALDDKQSFLSGLEAGADDYITKPYDRHELRARLLGITRLNQYRKILGERTDLEQTHLQLFSGFDSAIEGWSRAIDLRNKTQEGHTQRVAELTQRLAKIMGVNDKTLVYIQRGALLHDIGMLDVPESILFKVEKLTDEEWAVVKKHPQLAQDVIAPIEYLRPAVDIPYCHHEKWDGSGYPRGLKGDSIPLAARIFAVIDVWDALQQERVYRAAWDKEKATSYIREQAGKEFDPNVVELFCKMMEL